MLDFEAYLDDYLSSEHMLFLDAGVKEHAEGILRAFFLAAGTLGVRSLEELRIVTVESVLLRDMGLLHLPLAVRRGVPDALEGFFGYLQESGRWPAAGAWRVCVEALADRYRTALREHGDGKGGVRGETFRKASAEVGRNDPCFCGSGRKYKKSCGG
jgi:hypothetical protein